MKGQLSLSLRLKVLIEDECYVFMACVDLLNAVTTYSLLIFVEKPINSNLVTLTHPK